MSRPPCCRRVSGRPWSTVFKPAGIPMTELQETVMTLDEFEALRLADLEGRYQEDAAAEMHISRPTFSRIIESARRKLADALVNGRALRIEGGPVCPRNEGGPCCRSATTQPQEASTEPKPKRSKS